MFVDRKITFILIINMWSLRHKTKTFRRALMTVGVAGILLSPNLAAAATSTKNSKNTNPDTTAQSSNATVNQAYGVTGNLQQGMLVMLDPKNSKNVTELTNTAGSALQGVVVAANESAVTLSGDGSANQVYVATTGKYPVLVSTQNGVIKVGDIISISALDGVGMKADADEAVILGKALDAFNGTNNVSGTATLTTSNGQKKVSIGLIRVDIGISHNPLAHSGTDSKVPQFLRKLAEGVAGHPVDAARIYTALALLIVTLLTASSLLYGGVRSSLVSVGRNPLAKSPVLRGMVQVLFVGVIIFVLGMGVIYLLLKA